MATRRVRTGSRRSTRRSSNYQTGSSKTKIDKRLKAKHPGKRISKNGNIYYEHRKNRSDINRSTRL